MLWIVELRPEEFLHFAIFLISKVFGRISSICRQIQIGVRRTPQPVQRSMLRITKLPPQHKGLSSRDLSGLTQFLLPSSHRRASVLGIGNGLLQVRLFRPVFFSRSLQWSAALFSFTTILA